MNNLPEPSLELRVPPLDVGELSPCPQRRKRTRRHVEVPQGVPVPPLAPAQLRVLARRLSREEQVVSRCREAVRKLEMFFGRIVASKLAMHYTHVLVRLANPLRARMSGRQGEHRLAKLARL